MGGDAVNTGAPTDSMAFTVMAALAHMEVEIKQERITDSVSKRRWRARIWVGGGNGISIARSTMSDACSGSMYQGKKPHGGVGLQSIEDYCFHRCGHQFQGDRQSVAE